MGNDSTSLSSTVEPKANTRRGAKRIGYAEVRPDTMDFGLLLAGQNRILQIFIVNNRAKPFSWKADTGGASWLTFEGESSGQRCPDGFGEGTHCRDYGYRSSLTHKSTESHITKKSLGSPFRSVNFWHLLDSGRYRDNECDGLPTEGEQRAGDLGRDEQRELVDAEHI